MISETLKPGKKKSHSALKRRERFSTIAYPLAFGLVFWAFWQSQLLHLMVGADTFTLPLPSRMFGILLDNLPTVLNNVQATVIVSLSGLLLGSLLGYLLAAFADGFPALGVGGLSVVAAFNAIPIIAIAPILNNLTRDLSPDPYTRSMIAKSLVVTITSMVVMSVNAYRGFRELKPHSLDLMHSIAAPRRLIFWKLKLPNSWPYVFTALRVSVPGSIITAMVSEYFAEYIIGVGRQIRENIVLAQYATAWAYITAAFFIGIGMYALLLLAESLLLKGRPRP